MANNTTTFVLFNETCIITKPLFAQIFRVTENLTKLAYLPLSSSLILQVSILLRACRGHTPSVKAQDPNHMHCTAALTLNRYRHRGGLSSRGRLCPVQRLHPPRAGRARVHAYMCSRAGGLGILPPMEGLKPLSCAISTEECCAHSLSPKFLSSCGPCDHVSDTNGSLRTAL